MREIKEIEDREKKEVVAAEKHAQRVREFMFAPDSPRATSDSSSSSGSSSEEPPISPIILSRRLTQEISKPAGSQYQPPLYKTQEEADAALNEQFNAIQGELHSSWGVVLKDTHKKKLAVLGNKRRASRSPALVQRPYHAIPSPMTPLVPALAAPLAAPFAASAAVAKTSHPRNPIPIPNPNPKRINK